MTRTPRILMTADCVGGVWTYTMELIRALRIYDIQVVLATFGRGLSPAQVREAALLSNAEVREGAFKLEWMDEPWDDVERAGDWLLNLQEEFRPDLVHLNHYGHGNLDWNAPTIVVGHSCVLSWWRAVKGGFAPESWDRYAEVVGRGLRAATLVLAPSAFMLGELEDFYGPFPASAVVPNGRALPRLEQKRKEPTIFASGRLWDEGKNIRLLCNVAKGLPWPVCVAGEVGDNVCLEHVVSLGQLSTAEMLREFARASIYALPARYEPFGLSALEAALTGCALVLGDVPSLRDIWGDAAMFVSPQDPEELRAALLRLINDEPFRIDLAARARRIANHYTPERMAAQYMKHYSSVLFEKKEAVCAS